LEWCGAEDKNHVGCSVIRGRGRRRRGGRRKRRRGGEGGRRRRRRRLPISALPAAY
jgi:hypothetical protein